MGAYIGWEGGTGLEIDDQLTSAPLPVSVVRAIGGYGKVESREAIAARRIDF